MSDSIIVSRPDASAIVAEASPHVATAQSIVVTTDDHRVSALGVAKHLRSLSRKITEHFEPARKALDTAKKEVLAARDTLTKPLDAAVDLIDQKCQAFERIERAKAEDERIRLEAAALAEQEQQRELDAAMADTEEEMEAALTDPLPAPVVFVPPAVEKVAGVSESFTWDFEVVDKGAFLVAVSSQPFLYYLADPNSVNIKSLIRQKDGELGIPGVRAFKVQHRRFAR